MLKKSIGSALAVLLCAPLYAAEVVTPVATPQPTPLATTEASTPSAGQPSGRTMAWTCTGCHGTEGRLKGETFVPLAGMKEATFIKAMQNFRSGVRPATLMAHVARGYSDAEIKAMADYFAKIKP